jgi:hypothetical protein
LAPFCAVELSFELSATATATFSCVIAPSSPGLSIRTEITMFLGCC